MGPGGFSLGPLNLFFCAINSLEQMVSSVKITCKDNSIDLNFYNKTVTIPISISSTGSRGSNFKFNYGYTNHNAGLYYDTENNEIVKYIDNSIYIKNGYSNQGSYYHSYTENPLLRDESLLNAFSYLIGVKWSTDSNPTFTPRTETSVQSVDWEIVVNKTSDRVITEIVGVNLYSNGSTVNYSAGATWNMTISLREGAESMGYPPLNAEPVGSSMPSTYVKIISLP